MVLISVKWYGCRDIYIYIYCSCEYTVDGTSFADHLGVEHGRSHINVVLFIYLLLCHNSADSSRKKDFRADRTINPR